MTMLSAQHIGQRIGEALPGCRVSVEDYTGTGDHFRVEVTAPQFVGLTRVAQHQLIYAAVAGELADGSIHALSISTSTPQETP